MFKGRQYANSQAYTSGSDGFKSAIGKIGGTKEQPKDMGGGFFVQEDNVLGEFNIPPAHTKRQFQTYIRRGLGLMYEVANKEYWDVSERASGRYWAEELRDPKAKEFGCDPDFNAWTMDVNEPPDPLDKNLRSAGGHVHIGGVGGDGIWNLIRCLDLFLGVPSVVLDDDIERRKLYGKAGSFRFKAYGCEYRTLSNFWIFKPELISWVYDATLLAIRYAEAHEIGDNDPLADLIQECINKNRREHYYEIAKSIPDISIDHLIDKG